MKKILAMLLLLLPLASSGCIAFGGRSSGGWFIWPGGLGTIIVLLLIVWLIRRNR